MIASAYCALGLLVGFIAGITSSDISMTLMAALFTFVGGTGAYLLQVKPGDRKLMGTIIFCFSIFCLIGLVSGVTVKVNRLFDSAVGANQVVYLKSANFSDLDLINLKYAQGLISPDDAYKQTWAEIQKMRAARGK